MKPKKSAKKTKRVAKRAPKDLAPRTSVVGGNLANMKHESLKQIAQNLRG